MKAAQLFQQKTAPAFQFYASDTMADRRYRTMGLEERGLYLTLLCECWVNRSLPADPESLAKYLGLSSRAIQDAFSERVKSFFQIESGDISCPELERYRAEILDQRAKMSQGGKRGVEKRLLNSEQTAKPPLRVPLSHPSSYPSCHLQGHPQGSRVEMSRDELSRGESIRREVPKEEIDHWVAAYDEAAMAPQGSGGRTR